MFLYKLYDHDGALLYVGITNDPARRFSKHAGDKPWWPLVDRKHVEVVVDSEAKSLERRAIHDLRPLMNTMGMKRDASLTDPLDSWGDNLGLARTAAGFSQQDLAAEFGIAVKTVQRWESVGRRDDSYKPSTTYQRRLADLFNVRVTTLFPRTADEAALAETVAELEESLARVGNGCS